MAFFTSPSSRRRERREAPQDGTSETLRQGSVAQGGRLAGHPQVVHSGSAHGGCSRVPAFGCWAAFSLHLGIQKKGLLPGAPRCGEQRCAGESAGEFQQCFLGDRVAAFLCCFAAVGAAKRQAREALAGSSGLGALRQPVAKGKRGLLDRNTAIS